MSPLAYSALTAIIFTSAAGALIMCLLVFKYGFTPDPDELPSVSLRRVFITRLGHAVAGTCFASAAILAAVTLAELSSTAASTPAVLAADERRATQSRLTALASRLAAAELRLERADERVRNVDSGVRGAGSGVTAPQPPRVERVTVAPVAPRPVPPARQGSAPTEDLGSQMRRTWYAVKRGFATAGTEFRAALDQQARSLSRASN